MGSSKIKSLRLCVFAAKKFETAETQSRGEIVITIKNVFMMTSNRLNELSKEILDAAIGVHREMGPGLLESVYELCLLKELHIRKIHAENQVSIPLFYKGENLNKEFRIDILVEKEIIIELKAVDFILPVDEAQIISYLKLTDKKLGLLINFNVPLLKDGFNRYVNNF
ncbi:GxxExxY protein [Gaoshiqia sediminis]|uniref:GxxExxY protein n=1 Tax=Gaoshiqia sediminis TaxID=2986998 RepID=A0AA42C5C9_9BACT|nr:GxxExxY protein [Gaoshiqia sediminis]MCW0482688.1 GxxExxY protein [Gaoshiqia sediminis]